MSSKEKSSATMGSRGALVPKLRFPEFHDAGEWEERTVGDSILTITPPKKLQTADYEPEGDFPIIDQSQDYICGWTNDSEAVIDHGLPVIVFGDHTCVLKFVDHPFVQGADGIKIIRPRRGVLARFLYSALEANPVKQESYKRHFSTLKEKKLLFPASHSVEQRRIADCLDAVDTLIAAQGRKVEALRAHKKGLMQQIFPQEGEAQPRLRFPEFEGAGEWSEKDLDTLGTIQSGATPSKTNSEFWEGSIPWVSAKDMKRLFLEDTEEHISGKAVDNGARLVPAGTLLILTRGMTLLKDVPICILRRKMSFNQDVKGIRPKSGVNGLFLAWMLVSNKDRLLAMVSIAGHGTGKIDTEELKALLLRLPGPDEQKYIADCLTSLDDLIAAEMRKLDMLKTHKKGLMQQLFPWVGEANA